MATTAAAIAAACDVYSAGILLVELLMSVVRKGAAWATAMERDLALRRLRAGYGSELPADLRRALGIPGWVRQLAIRMLAWDAMVRPTAHEVLVELGARLLSWDRHNPYVGTGSTSSPQLVPAMESMTSRIPHNPHVGFFLDHRASAPF
eukprot:TRINITY_DN76779_c0_g1_i1.p3 TRINITY_DN76779_c0_g1~~TRINITY_DN76779_c0_g1_i1.p3  ORF type:complete len:165 (+),score=32.92 TRINITY_DN76779_c0_g1_i1:51-497(+)